jgi:hypothetical protein
MELVAIDWFKDTKRMDHVARRKGCAAQVRIYVLVILISFSARFFCDLLLHCYTAHETHVSNPESRTWNNRLPYLISWMTVG